MTIYIKFNKSTDSIMAITEYVHAKGLTLLNFIIICMSYDAYASLCNLKLIYPFIILYVVSCLNIYMCRLIVIHS